MVWKYLRKRRGFGLTENAIYKEHLIPRDSSPVMQALSDAAATQAFRRQLALRLPAGSILLLGGDLGAGKTCLVQGLAAGLGIEEPITSPQLRPRPALPAAEGRRAGAARSLPAGAARRRRRTDLPRRKRKPEH